MLYELINPSDPYIFQAPSKEIAALTVVVLGPAFGAKSQNEEETVPLFLFGGAEEWFQENFGKTIEEGMAEHRKEIANALLSFMYGEFEDYRRYQAAINAITDDAKREEFVREWQDGHSSLNDIGTYAHKTGKKILEKLEEENNG